MIRPGMLGYLDLRAAHWWPMEPPTSTKIGVSGSWLGDISSNGTTSSHVGRPALLACIHRPKFFAR